MAYLYKQRRLIDATGITLQFFLLLAFLFSASWLHADTVYKQVIEITLGDYRYMPSNIQLAINQPVVLRLVNVDSFTPHNFTLEDASDGLDVNVDIPAGGSVDVHLLPLVTGSHTFYCSNKFLFLNSHREKGMEGTLTVISDLQALRQGE